MCRLFGFRSILPSVVHRSLLSTDNALAAQSRRHPDGWGVAFYVDGFPQVIKRAEAAHDDHLFSRVGGAVASETVVAHIRKATVGPRTLLNSHPFQHGRWVFAHNGEVPVFARVREPILERISPCLRPWVLGETDSELVFLLFLTALRGAARPGINAVVEALHRVEQQLLEVLDGLADPADLLLNLIVTDGSRLVATRRGKELWWSTHKSRCPDRDACPRLAPVCEAPSANGPVHHLLVASEPLGGPNVWQEVPEGGFVGVDESMRLSLGTLAPVELRPMSALRVV